jgi:hypothetical protein
MSYGIPPSSENLALSRVIQRRITSDASWVAATAVCWRLLGLGGFCLLVGAGIGLACFGYSYVTDGRATLTKLSDALAASLDKVVFKVADVKGTVTLDKGGTVTLDKGGTVALDKGGTVRLETGATVRLETMPRSTEQTPRPTEQQLNGTATPSSHAAAVTNFTVFKTVQMAAGAVVTGWEFDSSDDALPYRQYCYYMEKDHVSAAIQYYIAINGDAVQPDARFPVDFAAAYGNCVWAGKSSPADTAAHKKT